MLPVLQAIEVTLQPSLLPGAGILMAFLDTQTVLMTVRRTAAEKLYYKSL